MGTLSQTCSFTSAQARLTLLECHSLLRRIWMETILTNNTLLEWARKEIMSMARMCNLYLQIKNLFSPEVRPVKKMKRIWRKLLTKHKKQWLNQELNYSLSRVKMKHCLLLLLTRLKLKQHYSVSKKQEPEDQVQLLQNQKKKKSYQTKQQKQRKPLMKK